MYLDKPSSIACGLNSDFNPKRERGITSNLNPSRGARLVAAAWFRGLNPNLKPSRCDVYAPRGRGIILNLIPFLNSKSCLIPMNMLQGRVWDVNLSGYSTAPIQEASGDDLTELYKAKAADCRDRGTGGWDLHSAI